MLSIQMCAPNESLITARFGAAQEMRQFIKQNNPPNILLSDKIGGSQGLLLDVNSINGQAKDITRQII